MAMRAARLEAPGEIEAGPVVLTDVQVPEPYRNLVLVVAAEAARRRKMPDHIELCMQACTNPALKQAFGLWLHSRSVPR